MTHPRGALFFLCAVQPLLLAAAPPPQGAPATTADALEDRTLKLKARGQYAEALAACRQALAAAVKEPDLATAAGQARAEFLARTLFLLGQRAGDRQVTARVCEELATPALRQAQPWVAGLLDLIRLQSLLTTRQQPPALALTRQLGFLADWQVIGPFDNERGRGFKAASEPEQGFDPDQAVEGKKRPVRWRRLDLADVPGAYADLGAILRPNEQALAYATTCVESDKDQTVALRTGSDEAIRIWVNGREVLSRDVRRPFGFDQDNVVARLRQGRNRILVKVMNQEGGFGFALRLTTPEGGALSGIKHTADPEAVRAAQATTEDGPELPAVRHGGQALAHAILNDQQAAPARDLVHAAACLAYNPSDDESGRRDRVLARRAVEAAPKDPLAHYLYGFTLVRQGKGHSADKDENQRRREYEVALELDPDYAEALRSLAEMDLEEMGRVPRAEALLRHALVVNPSFLNAQALELGCLRARRWQEAHDQLLERTARLPEAEGHVELLGMAADLMQRRGLIKDELEFRRRLLEEQFTADAAAGLARATLRSGDAAGARALLEEAVAAFPYARRPYLDLAQMAESTGDLTAAGTWIGRWLERCPEDDAAVLELADNAGRLGRDDKRLQLYKRALELNPNLKDTRRLVQFLESKERPFYEEFAVKGAELVKADPGAPADSKEANDACYYLLQHTVVCVYRDGTSSLYQHVIARILSEEGVRRFDTYGARYEREEQEARILDARVYRKDGTVENARFGRGGYVDLPTLAVGDAVEVAYRVDDLKQSFFGDYFGRKHEFVAHDRVPVHESRLDFVLDGTRTFYLHRKNGAPEPDVRKRQDGTVVQSFRMRDLPRLKIEAQRPDDSETSPQVHLTTYKDWNQFAFWWWNLIRKQMEPSPELSQKVKELTAGKTTELDKIRAIYNFVVTEVRYKAWEFGVHGYKPYSAAAILARRHGDCKDKAILLNAMLAEVGIKGYPVLIWADDPHSKDDLSIPLVEHFNHCIAWLPAKDGRPEMFLDGTAQYHEYRTTPAMDRGATVLVVEDGKGNVRDVPWTDPKENLLEREFTVKLDRAGNAEVEVVERPRMNHAVWIRDRYGNEPGKRKERLEDAYARMFGKVEVEEFKFSDLSNLDEPVEMRVKLKVKDFVQKQGDDFVLKSSLTPEDLVKSTGPETREFDLLLGPPSSKRTRVRYVLPEGFDPLPLSRPVVEDGPDLSFRMEWGRKDRSLLVEQEILYKSPRVSAKNYATFKDQAEKLDRAEKQILVVRPAQ